MNTNTIIARALVLFGLMGSVSPAYSQETPPDSAKARDIVAVVEKAAALVNTKGRAAFAEFRKIGSEWRHGDLYLFANDMKEIQLLNAGFPEREGIDGSKFKDTTGKLIWPDFMKAVRSTKGAGWVSYSFPKPGQTKPSKKWSYLKAVSVDGTPALIGAGFYQE